METVVSSSKPIQSKWFEIGERAKYGYLCLSIIRPPQFALTVELRVSGKKYEVAICIISFAVIYQWDKGG